MLSNVHYILYCILLQLLIRVFTIIYEQVLTTTASDRTKCSHHHQLHVSTVVSTYIIIYYFDGLASSIIIPTHVPHFFDFHNIQMRDGFLTTYFYQYFFILCSATACYCFLSPSNKNVSMLTPAKFPKRWSIVVCSYKEL